MSACGDLYPLFLFELEVLDDGAGFEGSTEDMYNTPRFGEMNGWRDRVSCLDRAHISELF